jgi:putative membrane protein
LPDRAAAQDRHNFNGETRTMKMSKTLLAAALALALAACDNNSTMVDSGSGPTGDPPNSTGDTEDRSRGIAATESAPDAPVNTAIPMGDASTLADGDRNALMAVMEVDQHEIEASEAALSKDLQGPVRAYAETLRREHTQNLEATRTLLGTTADQTGHEMTTVAGGTATTTTNATSDARGATPELAEMKRKHEAERAQLASLSGERFQTAWIDAMVKGHQEALRKLDSELIPGSSDARVKAHLQSTRTAIAAHLETAKALQQPQSTS